MREERVSAAGRFIPAMLTAAVALAASASLAGVLAATAPESPAEPANQHSISVDDTAAILRAADAPHDAFREGVIHLRITTAEPGRKPDESVLDLFVKGNDRSLCVFTGGKQKGRKILTVGDKVWLIVPSVSHPIPVTANQRLAGAASFGDIARLRLSDQFTASQRVGYEMEPDGALETPCRVLDLTASHPGAPYASGVLWVSRANGLSRRLRLSLPSGKESKEIVFSGYRKEGGATRLGRMEIRELLSRPGSKARPDSDADIGLTTVIDFQRFDSGPLDDSMFDPRESSGR